MAYHATNVLAMVKARLNRLPEDTMLDVYLENRIKAADEEFQSIGIRLEEDRADDAMLLTDMVVWQYQNRDTNAGMPDWLRLRRRERFLQQMQRGGGGM